VLRIEQADPRIVGRRLAQARTARGRTQEEAATHLGCSRPTLIAIEKGTRPPKPDEIVRLAAFYGRSVHDIVRPGAPDVELAPHLRAAIGASERDAAGLDAAIGELQAFAEDYRELERAVGARPFENYPPQVELRHALSLDECAEAAANRERLRLCVGDQPVPNLRQLLENDVGLRVFCGSMPSCVAGMYAYVADLGYCVLINGKHPRERQRFTLAHEYGHFLCNRHKPGVDYITWQGRKPRSESFADAFASSLLMPESGLRRHFVDITMSTGDFQVADLCRLSVLYGASVQAMTLRLESVGLIRAGTWDLLREFDFRPAAAKSDLGLPSVSKESPEPYPERYKYLAVQAFCQEKITEGQLARFLRCDRVRAREIVVECQSSSDLGPGGDEQVLRMPLEESLLKKASG
jgi:Zn-dependent peptidase ImmA (M78 family)/transcriptional regulator with XRE-family HTH domain